MSFQDEVNRVEQGLRAELYRLSTGGNSWYYTSYQASVTFQNQVYLPRPITRSDFSTDNALKAIKVNIQAPVVEPLVQLIATAPYLPMYVDIIRCYLTDPSALYRVIFSGVIYGVGVENKTLTAECVSDGGILDKQFPRIFYQSYCNHNLYDAKCGMDPMKFRVVTTCQGVSETNLTISAAAGRENGYFTGGRLVLAENNDMRLITSHVGSAVKILVGIPELDPGKEVHLYTGCNGDIRTCRIKFANSNRFLGMAYMPTKNPLVWGFR